MLGRERVEGEGLGTVNFLSHFERYLRAPLVKYNLTCLVKHSHG